MINANLYDLMLIANPIPNKVGFKSPQEQIF
jgi:hypothetical protein